MPALDATPDVRHGEEVATLRRARLLGYNYVDTSRLANKPLFRDLLSVPEMYKKRVVPMQHTKNTALFGITTTTTTTTINEIKERFNDLSIKVAIISESGYKEYMRLYDPPKKIVYDEISFAANAGSNLFQSVTDTLSQVRADDILGYLVQQGHRLKASDIHLENERDQVRIRFRVDGVLHPIASLTREKYQQLLSAIVIAANVQKGIDMAQTGHINTSYQLATGDSVNVNLRVETVPTAYGQDVVMRIFTLKLEQFNLDKLGLNDREREIVQDVIRHPTGLVMMVGPTGSGKTTTLYSVVNTLNTPERKIITLEDPIEYFMNGIVQIPVHGDSNDKGFASGLRAVLRLDPDIVMVGEIRDQDTAKTSLQAALTGHLVLSTFHANGTAAAITRMLDFIGINPLFASAIHLIMAQRLVRLLDEDTKIGFRPDQDLIWQLQTILDTLPDGVERPNMSQVTLYKAGSSPEIPFGYKGQMAVREQLQMTPGVQKLLKKPPNEITTELLEERARKDGMITLLQDGILKVISGKTTLEEIYRIIG